MSDLETQARIVHTRNQMRDELRNLYEWEEDMKKKEAKRTTSNEAFDWSFPLRNQQSGPSTSTESVSNPKRSAPNAIEKANEFKTRGNDCVKKAEYQKAIHYYTEAIRLNKSEPVFYTNRALCFLKQNKPAESIEDCTTAIGLDNKAVKAYYRRMQAYEQLNENLEAALSDCKTVLSIEPKNVDAQRSLGRLESLVKVTHQNNPIAEEKIPQWSQLEGKDGYEQIDFVSKAPHLRSKEPLKRIKIGDNDGNKKPTAKVAEAKSNQQQTDEQTSPIKPDSKQQSKPIDLVIPKNSAQFFKSWKSIKDDAQRFIILKGIYNNNISKILGAQFSLDILRDIFSIVKSHFINQNLPISKILNGILTNQQMSIISVMMNAEDKLSFTKMVEYMRIRGEDANKIDAIEKMFDDLISM